MGFGYQKVIRQYDGGDNNFGVQQDTNGFNNPTNKEGSTNKDYTIYLIGGGALVFFLFFTTKNNYLHNIY